MGLKLTNNAISVLASGIAAGATSIALAAGTGSRFPTLGASDYHPATISKPDGTFEIVKVTARSGDMLTVTRAQEGTTALSFNAGDLIELRITASTIDFVLKQQYESKIVSADTVLDANTEYITGSGLRIAPGVNLRVPVTTRLEIKPFLSGKTF